MKFKRNSISVLFSALLASTIVFSACSKTDGGKNGTDSLKESSTVSEVTSEQQNSDDPKTDISEKSDKASEDNSSSESDSSKKPQQQDDEKSQISSAEQSDKESSTESSADESSSEQEKTKSTISPAVWEVTDANGNSIYMMGSIHLADKEAEVMPDYFETAFAKCDSLAVECDITSASMNMSVIRKVMYSDGSTVKDHVPEDQYDKAVKLLTDAGVYTSLYDYFKPIVWVELGETASAHNAGLNAQYGVDSNLIARAKGEGKEVIELESLSFQYDILSGLSDELQKLLFEQLTIDGYMEEATKSLSELYTNWKKGTLDETITNPDHSADLTAEEQKLIRDYNKVLIDDRNVGMAEKSFGFLKEGKKVMVVVGAAHYYGEKGVLKLMENYGCTIKRLGSGDAEESVQNSQETQESVASSVSQTETDPGIPRAA